MSKLTWGSVAPDVLPYYRLIRHYKDESIEYITNEIIMLVRMFRYSKYENLNKIQLNYLSRKIGIISHYLCDYTCYPHAHRQTYVNGMREHMKYETELNRYSSVHDYKDIHLKGFELSDKGKISEDIKIYINEIVDEYMSESPKFSVDLNYALFLSYQITSFIIETILSYSEDMEYRLI